MCFCCRAFNGDWGTDTAQELPEGHQTPGERHEGGRKEVPEKERGSDPEIFRHLQGHQEEDIIEESRVGRFACVLQPLMHDDL